MKFRVFQEGPEFFSIQTATPIKDPRWWTVSRMTDGWLITSGRGGYRMVQEDGKLGKAIVAAVEKFIEDARAG